MRTRPNSSVSEQISRQFEFRIFATGKFTKWHSATCQQPKSKKKKSSEPGSLLSGFVPSPGTSPNNDQNLLVERVECQDARFVVGANAQWIDANHSIFFRAESTDTSLVDRDRLSLNRVSNCKTAGQCARAG